MSKDRLVVHKEVMGSIIEILYNEEDSLSLAEIVMVLEIVKLSIFDSMKEYDN